MIKNMLLLMMTKMITNKTLTPQKKLVGKRAIATSTIGYIILGIFALVIVLMLIYGFLTGSLDVVGKIFGD